MKDNQQKRNHKNKDNRYVPSEPKQKQSYESKYDPMRKNKNYWKSQYQ